MVINWTNSAIKDLKEFKDNTKISNSIGYILNLVGYVNVLLEQPRLGKIYSYNKRHIIRQLIYEKHKILYYINNDKINIIAIIHHRQDINKKIEYIRKHLDL